MPSNAQYLALSAYSPRLNDDNVGVNPEITLRFNTPVDTSLVDTDAVLNQYLVLTDLESARTVPLTYGDWDATNNLLTLAPSGTLQAGTLYQVTVLKTLKNAQGRAMTENRTWAFQTAAGAITKVELASPGDSTAWSTAPTLRWTGVWTSGSVTYDVQLNQDWQFINPVWETAVTVSGSGGVQSASIGVALIERSTYYWRVRARSLGLSGEWSEPWSFWVGTSRQASPDTRLVYEPPTVFRVDHYGIPNGTPHLGYWPPIQAVFTRDVDATSVTSGNFYLWKIPVDGRQNQGSTVVGGTISIAGDTLTFTPGESITPNTRYTLIVGSTLTSEDGDALEGCEQTYFTSTYRPLYGGLYTIRAALGGFIEDISDDEILFQLWQASLKVHEILITRYHRIRRMVSYDELLVYQPPADTWGMKEYAELECQISLLESYYFDLQREAGRKSVLGTFETEVSVDTLKELRARIEQLKLEREQVAAAFLFEITVPRTTIKSRMWSPENLGVAQDGSYKPRKTFSS